MVRGGIWPALLVVLQVIAYLPLPTLLASANGLGGTVVWTKNNPTPWNDVKPDENTKMMDVNSRFAKRCVVCSMLRAGLTYWCYQLVEGQAIT